MNEAISLSLGDARPLGPDQTHSGRRRRKMKMLKLTRVTGRMVDTDHPEGEDDGLSNVTEFPRQEETTPVILDATQVRNFYPRKGGRPGTRILFRNGSALPVTETFDEVEQKIREALAA